MSKCDICPYKGSEASIYTYSTNSDSEIRVCSRCLVVLKELSQNNKEVIIRYKKSEDR